LKLGGPPPGAAGNGKGSNKTKIGLKWFLEGKVWVTLIVSSNKTKIGLKSVDQYAEYTYEGTEARIRLR